MTEWREVTLGEVTTKIGSGATPRGGKEAYRRAGIALIRSMNIFDDGFKHDGLAYIDDAQAAKLQHVEVDRDDVLVNITGASVARCCIAPHSVLPARVNQHVAIIRLRRDQANPRFVSAYLVSPEGKGRLLNLASAGATREALTKRMLETFTIRLPDVGAQDRVAAVLESLDGLIESTRRRAEVLEEMARAIYREWFVRVRYPGHEDAPLSDSPLGSIPEGWRPATVGDCASALVDGDWIETKDQGGSDYRLLQVSNIGVGRFRETGKFRYVSSETFDRLRCTAIEAGDILISRMPDPIGRAWLVDDLPQPAITAVDVAILTPRSNAIGSYLNQVLNSPEHLAWAETVATGTTRKRITRSVLSQAVLLLPDDRILERYHAETSAMRSMAVGLRGSEMALAAMRDLLLPRLVTGQIDVSHLNLDELTEAATA